MTEVQLQQYLQANPGLGGVVEYLDRKFSDKLQSVVKNICDIIVTQYDRQIADNKIQISELQADLRKLQAELWNENVD